VAVLRLVAIATAITPRRAWPHDPGSLAKKCTLLKGQHTRDCRLQVM